MHLASLTDEVSNRSLGRHPHAPSSCYRGDATTFERRVGSRVECRAGSTRQAIIKLAPFVQGEKWTAMLSYWLLLVGVLVRIPPWLNVQR